MGQYNDPAIVFPARITDVAPAPPILATVIAKRTPSFGALEGSGSTAGSCLKSSADYR